MSRGFPLISGFLERQGGPAAVAWLNNGGSGVFAVQCCDGSFLFIRVNQQHGGICVKWSTMVRMDAVFLEVTGWQGSFSDPDRLMPRDSMLPHLNDSIKHIHTHTWIYAQCNTPMQTDKHSM